MRIAFFHNLPAGGGKRSAHEWVKRMAKNHDVDLYLFDSQAEDFLDMRPFVRKTILMSRRKTSYGGHVGRLVSLCRARLLSKQIAQRINSGNYDLAFIMQCKVYNTPFVLRYLQIPALYFCHEPLIKALEPHSIVNRGRLAPLKRLFTELLGQLDRSNAKYATLICTNSLYSRESIYRSYAVYPRLNYLGVDPEHFHPLFMKREPVILSVGSLFPSKAPDFIIESVATTKTKPAIRFIYHVSDKHYQAQLAQLAEQLGVSVSFDYLPTQKDLMIAYNRAALTAFPCMLEPLGLVPLESMACGTPVVGIAEAGIRETVQHNENGLLTERDPHEFGQAIDTLMEDKNMWKRMSSLGHQRVLERWTWEKSYQQLEKHMQMAVKMHKARMLRGG